MFGYYWPARNWREHGMARIEARIIAARRIARVLDCFAAGAAFASGATRCRLSRWLRQLQQESHQPRDIASTLLESRKGARRVSWTLKVTGRRSSASIFTLGSGARGRRRLRAPARCSKVTLRGRLPCCHSADRAGCGTGASGGACPGARDGAMV